MIGSEFLINPFELRDGDSEDSHQKGLMEWCRAGARYGRRCDTQLLYSTARHGFVSIDMDDSENCNNYRLLKWVYAVPNGGMRNIVTAMKLVNSGVKKGVFDIGLDVARRGKHGLKIEMKKVGGKISPEQEEWEWFYHSQGYEAKVCFGFKEARQVLVDYLGLPNVEG